MGFLCKFLRGDAMTEFFYLRLGRVRRCHIPTKPMEPAPPSHLYRPISRDSPLYVFAYDDRRWRARRCISYGSPFRDVSWRSHCYIRPFPSQLELKTRSSLGDFRVHADSPASLDVVLLRKCESSGEEVLVSAELSQDILRKDGVFPWVALLKICVKKPGLSSSFLQFDCRVYSRKSDYQSLEFKVHKVSYLPIPSPSSLDHASIDRGTFFTRLDPKLQEALKQYLIGKGIGQELILFLLHHLHNKEADQCLFDWGLRGMGTCISRALNWKKPTLTG